MSKQSEVNLSSPFGAHVCGILSGIKLKKKKIMINDTAISSEGEPCNFPLSTKRLPKGKASLKTQVCELCASRVRNSSTGLGLTAGRVGVSREPRPKPGPRPPVPDGGSRGAGRLRPYPGSASHAGTNPRRLHPCRLCLHGQ